MLRLTIALFLTAITLYWTLSGTNWTSIQQTVQNAEWSLMLIAGVLFMFQQLLRSVRQWMLLRGERPEHKVDESMSILCISFFFINIFPLRLGEVVRPLLFVKREKISLGEAGALVFVERLVDLASAFLMMLIVLAFANIVAISADTHDSSIVTWVNAAQSGASIALPVLLSLLVVFFALPEQLTKLVQRLKLPSAVESIVLQFLRGGQRLRQQRQVLPMILITIVIWGMSVFMYTLAADAFGLGEYIGYVEGMALGVHNAGNGRRAHGFHWPIRSSFRRRIDSWFSFPVKHRFGFELSLLDLSSAGSSAVFYLYRDGLDLAHFENLVTFQSPNGARALQPRQNGSDIR